MALSIEQIEQISVLARLSLTEEEKKQYAEQLSVVLDYIEVLNEVDTEGVPETSQVTGLEDIVREDQVIDIPEDIKQKLIESFPGQKGNLLKVKAVFE